ncbi:hypothetical protein ABK040_000688 [Willaertia magna]
MKKEEEEIVPVGSTTTNTTTNNNSLKQKQITTITTTTTLPSDTYYYYTNLTTTTNHHNDQFYPTITSDNHIQTIIPNNNITTTNQQKHCSSLSIHLPLSYLTNNNNNNNTLTKLIHERQQRQFCGKHAINNLLQTNISINKFIQIANQLYQLEKELLTIDITNKFIKYLKCKFLFKNNHLTCYLNICWGNFSFEVLEMILNELNFNLENLKLNLILLNNLKNDIFMLNNENVIGILINVQKVKNRNAYNDDDYKNKEVSCFSMFGRKKKSETSSSRQELKRVITGGHWFTIGKIYSINGNGNNISPSTEDHGKIDNNTIIESNHLESNNFVMWYNHDSNLKEAQPFQKLSDVYKYLLQLYKDFGDDVFVWKVYKNNF